MVCVRALSFCLLVALFAVVVHADFPGFPHAFYGEVEIEGEPASVGTEIEARGTGVSTDVKDNPLTTTQQGRYGGPGIADRKLTVQGEIAEGTSIRFYVDGRQAQCALPDGPWQDSFPFSSGATTELDLRVGESVTLTAVSLYLPVVYGAPAGGSR
jgi:hypothetical protein